MIFLRKATIYAKIANEKEDSLMLKINHDKGFKIYSLEMSSIKRFFIIDLAFGSGVYYVIMMLVPHQAIAIGGSIAVTEGVKRVLKLAARR
jgi:hypothetical protein